MRVVKHAKLAMVSGHLTPRRYEAANAGPETSRTSGLETKDQRPETRDQRQFYSRKIFSPAIPLSALRVSTTSGNFFGSAVKSNDVWFVQMTTQSTPRFTASSSVIDGMFRSMWSSAGTNGS